MLELAKAIQSEQLSRSTIEVCDVIGLTSIFEEDVNIVTLRRRLQSAIELETAAQKPRKPQSLPVLRERVPATPAGFALLSNALPNAEQLAIDIAKWAEVLGDLVGASEVGVRLHWLTTAVCPRFHTDRVTIRLVCTYCGLATEYLDNQDVDRRFLGHGAGGVPDESSGLMRLGAKVRMAGAGDVVLLKGEQWPGNDGKGCVHRSPIPIQDEPRLVLTMDPLCN